MPLCDYDDTPEGCLGGDECVCDDHPQDLCECEGTGERIVLMGTVAISLPCPDCELGDLT